MRPSVWFDVLFGFGWALACAGLWLLHPGLALTGAGAGLVAVSVLGAKRCS